MLAGLVVEYGISGAAVSNRIRSYRVIVKIYDLCATFLLL